MKLDEIVVSAIIISSIKAVVELTIIKGSAKEGTEIESVLV